jgi:hypothetical protein
LKTGSGHRVIVGKLSEVFLIPTGMTGEAAVTVTATVEAIAETTGKGSFMNLDFMILFE